MYDQNQGFGRTKLINSLKLKGENSFDMFVVDSVVLSAGNSMMEMEYGFKINSTCVNSLSATLVWHDPPGAIGAAKPVLNDLDLLITVMSSGAKRYPNGRTSRDPINNS